eukprot:gnl/Dysnectes_brevis/2033_a2346_1524.p1 GENE.gnl/Dysnectes_brevis/2033_a2346_1524~~gnl/Dysnectes_brevis/2033_a2346_1524.p1  ORF type:complete len:507 (+),score=117.14 gnl/Dysnectes_brevis/2033_a2346_1524:63-1523(+)
MMHRRDSDPVLTRHSNFKYQRGNSFPAFIASQTQHLPQQFEEDRRSSVSSTLASPTFRISGSHTSLQRRNSREGLSSGSHTPIETERDSSLVPGTQTHNSYALPALGSPHSTAKAQHCPDPGPTNPSPLRRKKRTRTRTPTRHKSRRRKDTVRRSPVSRGAPRTHPRGASPHSLSPLPSPRGKGPIVLPTGATGHGLGSSGAGRSSSQSSLRRPAPLDLQSLQSQSFTAHLKYVMKAPSPDLVNSLYCRLGDMIHFITKHHSDPSKIRTLLITINALSIYLALNPVHTEGQHKLLETSLMLTYAGADKQQSSLLLLAALAPIAPRGTAKELLERATDKQTGGKQLRMIFTVGRLAAENPSEITSIVSESAACIEELVCTYVTIARKHGHSTAPVDKQRPIPRPSGLSRLLPPPVCFASLSDAAYWFGDFLLRLMEEMAALGMRSLFTQARSMGIECSGLELYTLPGDEAARQRAHSFRCYLKEKGF